MSNYISQKFQAKMKQTYLVYLNCYRTTNNFFRGNKKKCLKTYAYIINQREHQHKVLTLKVCAKETKG